MDCWAGVFTVKPTECKCLEIHTEGRFQDWNDIENLEESIRTSGILEQVPVSEKRNDAAGDERWFSCKTCGRLWRIAYPDAPFRGFWAELKGKVSESK
jgi:hypothetical protein